MVKYFLLAVFFIALQALGKAPVQDSFTLSSYGFSEPWEHYKVAIFPDGITVLIIENENAATRSFRIGNTGDTFSKILEVLDNFQFDDFADSYGWNNGSEIDPSYKELLSHSNASVLVLQYAGKVKTINYNHGCTGFPREGELKQLAKRIKNILGLGDYVGI
jgi:hypothetical protein